VTTVASTVGKFVWHEQVSSDPKQAQDFYAQLFGWDAEVFKPGEVDYTMISSGGQSHGGFGKAQEGAPRDGREGQERGREAPCGPVRDG
jgi:predicted enzyme related to lactoylglutathione lyase